MPPSWTITEFEDDDGADPVSEFLTSLTREERERIRARLKVLRDEGLNARSEYLKKLKRNKGRRQQKKLRDDLWELRAPKSRHNPRILLFAVRGRRIILLHGLKKIGRPNDKVPESDIRIAEQRMKRFLEREGLL